MTRNIVPIGGLVFLDWQAVNLVVLYYVDFVLDIGVCVALLMLLDPEMKEMFASESRSAGPIKTWLGILLAFVALVGFIALVMGTPVFFMFGMDSDISPAKLLADNRFRGALVVHVLLSSWTFVQVFRAFRYLGATDAKFKVHVPIKGRFGFVMVRWVWVYATGLVAAMFFPALMVIAYCAATIYIELKPRSVGEFLGP